MARRLQEIACEKIHVFAFDEMRKKGHMALELVLLVWTMPKGSSKQYSF